MNNKIYKTDWLASNPIFYNNKTNKVSENINEVIDFSDLEFHPEGVKNYLEFGYSVFGQSPVKNVKILPPNSELKITSKGIKIVKLNDPVEKYISRETSEEKVFELIQNKISNWEKSTKGEIVIPTSGGFDSRLLNTMMFDKSHINSFTYGVSEIQSRSSEIVYAQELSRKLGTKWQAIKLGKYHNYLGLWNQLFGPSTHAHGMYQIEFYKKILDVIKKPNWVLSGIIGDIWAGTLSVEKVNRPSDLIKLGYIHGINADHNQLKLKSNNEIRDQFFEENKNKLKNDKWKVVIAMRLKLILLNYLTKIPEYLGFKTFAPFLDIEIAMAMLCLPQNRRSNRNWQIDYFKKNNLYFEDAKLSATMNNTLDLQAMDMIPLPPLNKKLLREIIQDDYIDSINNALANPSLLGRFQRFSYKTFSTPSLLKTLNSFGVYDRYSFTDYEIKAYNAYMTLKPLEGLIKNGK